MTTKKTFAQIMFCAVFAAVAALCGIAGTGDARTDAPACLTVERLPQPYGVDSAAPRLGWKMRAGKGASGVLQTAYRILVATSPGKLAADEGDLWDSGKVEGDISVDIAYAGKPLPPSTRCWWKVRTWDDDGAASAWSEPSCWITGIMPPGGWKAKWIGPDASTQPDADMGGARWVTGVPGPKNAIVISKTFDFDPDSLKRGQFVEMFHAASVEHEITVNGKNFHKPIGHIPDIERVRFRDITPWLVKGRNEMTVSISATPGGTPRAFIASIRFPDGRRIVTDRTWGTDLGGVRETPYGRKLNLRHEIASPAFEKTFTAAKPVAEAILHITGLGFYEASLNGSRIGDKVLDPAPTCYDRHVMYSTYDISRMVKQGANTLKVLVGHGWYDVRATASWNFASAPWRDFPRMIAQLELRYADGTSETVVSDGSWRQVESPVGFDCIREAEVIGAHHPLQPDFAARTINAAEVPAPKGRLVAENCAPSRVVRTISPSSVHAFPDGTCVVAFPENFAGWIRMKVRGQKKGDLLVVRYDERVNTDFSPATPSPRNGLFSSKPVDVREARAGEETRRIDCHFSYTASEDVCAVGAEFQADRFVSSGAEVETYEPRFTYNGFQYVVLKGLRQVPSESDITGCVVHTDFKTVGSFACSDDNFNKLMLMGDRAYRSNFANGVPTDCPHREKNGWTGDASIASELAQFCYENTAGYEKWLRDLIDTQLPSGDISCIAPTSGWGFKWGNGPAWDSALPVVAWNLWCYRGDRRILETVYPALKRYVDFTGTKAEGHLVKHGLGDWIPVNPKHMPSVELTSSCYYRQAAAILSRIAAILGHADESSRYASLADDIAAAINRKFYKGNGVYDNGLQTAQAFPIAFGIVPASERKAVADRLAAAVEETGGHVDMGLLGTKHVFRALSRTGRTDLAFKMLVNPTAPSPMEWLQKGGTTLWEDWKDGASRNHIMFGDFVAWAYQFIGGIQLSEKPGSCAAIPDVTAPGLKEVVIAPQFIDALEWAKASVDGPYGTVAVSWRREGGSVTVHLSVPPNTAAIVRLPGLPERRVGSGEHVFTVPSGAGACAGRVFGDAFADGARMCFVGDSITKQANWCGPLTDYMYTRFPERSFRFFNAGIAGDTAGGCLSRFAEDVAAHNPTVATVMFGMNDVNRGCYVDNPTPGKIKCRNAALEGYARNLEKISGAFAEQAPGARICWITPSPYDEAAPSDRPVQTGCGRAVGICAEIVRKHAAGRGDRIAELHAPMEAFNEKWRKADPSFKTLCGTDRIHPREDGGFFMAYTLLKSWGAPALVSDVTLDAGSCRCLASENASVSGIGSQDGRFFFTVLEKALPLPVCDGAKTVAGRLDVAGTLNREFLRVKGLPAGKWTLSIDGKPVVSASAQEWGDGVNLSSLPTPQLEQAKRLSAENARRIAKEVYVRTLAGERHFLRPRVKNIDDWQEVERVAKTFEGQEGFFQKLLPKYIAEWRDAGKILGQLKELEDRIEAVRRPVPHRYGLSRSGT